jgi:transglutaminase-like putative cysteine protease
MSVSVGPASVRTLLGRVLVRPTDTESADLRFRALALGSTLVVIATYLSVYYEVTSIVGGTTRLTTLVVAAFVVATVLAGLVEERTATVLGGGLFTIGIVWYLLSTPITIGSLFGGLLRALVDALALATGNSVRGIAAASRWAAATAPPTVFLSWYLAMRGQYARAAGVGGAIVGYFVLTSDLVLGGIVGMLACFCVIGCGELERRGGDTDQANLLVVLLAVMAVTGLFATAIPASDGTTFGTGGISGTNAGGGPADIEASLVTEDESLTVQGPISLSPEVRFAVTADAAARWRVGTYDRYTGNGWVRTEGTSAYKWSIEPSPGPTAENRQEVRFEAGASVMPAAAQPVSVGTGVQDRTLVTAHGSLVPKGTFQPGDEYSVVSERPQITPPARSEPPSAVPDRISRRYTQLPGSTPDRVGRFTSDLTAETTSVYETARLIERFLEREKEYSLDVDRPSGHIADSFLFEMEAGYCTYYATTMVTMLRTQDIPARLAVGYNTGQQVSSNQWVVRGSDAHAWVEVYLPTVGWIEFDPTPAADWTDARRSAVSTARTFDRSAENVDTAETAGQPYAPAGSVGDQSSNKADETTTNETSGGNETTSEAGQPTPGEQAIARAGSGPAGGASQSIPSLSTSEYERSDQRLLPVTLPDGNLLLIGLVLVAGAIAGLRTTAPTDQVRRWIQLYRQRPGRDPDRTAVEAGERVETLLTHQHRPRRPAETRHEYLATLPEPLDDRVEQVFDVAARAEYGDGITEAEAEAAVEQADELVAQSAPLRRVLRRKLP